MGVVGDTETQSEAKMAGAIQHVDNLAELFRRHAWLGLLYFFLNHEVNEFQRYAKKNSEKIKRELQEKMNYSLS
jgi:hypothetical protein